MKKMDKNNQSKELNEEIIKGTFMTLNDMIVWIAKRTLTANEFEQFLKEFYEEK